MSDLPKTTRYTATTALACAISGAHPDRFNEAVANGNYPCAPRTKAGKKRSFAVNDIIAMRVYKMALDTGTRPEWAGKKACLIREFLDQYPDADKACLISTNFKEWDRVFPDFDTSQYMMEINPSQSVSVTAIEIIPFHFLRGLIVHKIEEAAKTVGE